MQRSSILAKANSSVSSLEITHILWHPKVNYCLHDSLPLVCTLSLKNPVHALPSYFITIHFNIKLGPMPMSSEWSPSYRIVYLINKVIFYDSYISWSSSLCNFLQYPVMSSEHLPWHSFHKHPQLVFLLSIWRLGFTPNRQNFNSEYSNPDVWDRKLQDKRFWTKR